MYINPPGDPSLKVKINKIRRKNTLNFNNLNLKSSIYKDILYVKENFYEAI